MQIDQTYLHTEQVSHELHQKPLPGENNRKLGPSECVMSDDDEWSLVFILSKTHQGHVSSQTDEGDSSIPTTNQAHPAL